MTSTNSSAWYDRETKQIELERRLISDERYGEAVLLYPQLKGAEESVAAMQRAMIDSEIEDREQELLKLREQAIRIGEDRDFDLSKSLSGFASRFLRWIEQGCPEREMK